LLKHKVTVITRPREDEFNSVDVFNDAKVIIDRGILQVIDESRRCAENGYRSVVTEYSPGFWNKVIYDGE
jgi:hypothetical protein